MTTINPPAETQRERRGHDFYPSETAWAAIPALYATEQMDDESKLIQLHYFLGACDWWVTEVDPVEARAFGYVCLSDPQMAEWGYIDLQELEALSVRVQGIRLVVERDLHWRPKPVRDVALPGNGNLVASSAGWHACDACGKPFVGSDWEHRHTVHLKGCSKRSSGDSCDCVDPPQVHPGCCTDCPVPG